MRQTYPPPAAFDWGQPLFCRGITPYAPRKYIAIGVALLFVLFVTAAMAQTTSGSSGQYGSQSSATTSNQSQTSSASQTGTSGKERTVEGCIAKEESDYFLVPRSGNPILLQASAGENPGAHEGHRVKVKGVETSKSAAGGAGTAGGTAGTTAQSSTTSQTGQENPSAVGSQTGAASGASATGNDLHRLSDREMTVDKITMVSDSCPANWNPSVKLPSNSSPSGSSTPPPAR